MIETENNTIILDPTRLPPSIRTHILTTKPQPVEIDTKLLVSMKVIMNGRRR